MQWNLTEAKSRLSEVLNRVDAEGEQVITRRDRDYVLIPGDEYRRLKGDIPNFVDLLVNEGPRFDKQLKLPKRTARPLRDLGL